MQKDNNGHELVDQYISQFTTETQERLLKIREIIRKAASEAEETFAYQMPTYRLNGNLVHFAALKNHIGFYPINIFCSRPTDPNDQSGLERLA